MEHNTIITNDASVLGLLVIILAFIIYTSSSINPFWTTFYTYIPALLLCYFLPSILNSLGIISGDESGVFYGISVFASCLSSFVNLKY